MTPEIHAQLVRLADHTPSAYKGAWQWFLAQGPSVAPALAEGPMMEFGPLSESILSTRL